MKKFARFIAINIIGLFIIQFLIGSGLDLVHRRAKIFKTNLIYSSANELMRYDGLILGGSRGLTGLDSKVISRKTAKKVFNLCTDDTQLPVHLMQLKMLLKRKIKPQFVILDLLGTGGYSHNSLRYMPMIGDQDIDSYFLKYKGAAWLRMQKIFPLYKYSYYNVELFYPTFAILAHKNYQYRSDVNGDYCYPDSRIEVKKDSTEHYFIGRCSEIDEFKSLCAKNGIRLYIIIEPFFRDEVNTADSDILNFSNLYDEKPYYFYDLMHLKQAGRANYSELIGDTLAHLLNQPFQTK